MDDQLLLMALKVELLANGMRLTREALDVLMGDGKPVSVFEYPTTSGVTLDLGRGYYVNAPFAGVYEGSAKAVLHGDSDAGELVIEWNGSHFSARAMPLPGYLETKGADGHNVTDLAMSHADRLRLSPVRGCSFSCGFCDCPSQDYHMYSIESLLEAMTIGLNDLALPARHILISGGTPRRKDESKMDQIYETLLFESPAPVDVMLAPRFTGQEIVDKLVSWGIHGFSINIEIFNSEVAKRFCPQKAELGLDRYSKMIEKAVSLTGGEGRVRSLILIGLDSKESVLQGVNWIAERGADPVLSPFRPATGTALQNFPQPSGNDLAEIWEASQELAHTHGVQIGPRCLPCQHNALAFPWPTNEIE